ncbi:MAG: hypothetical protein Q9M50_09515 [Methylococcales bacterium]|nr:hypothetical protein [Methylococcales bacterium]
MLRRHYLTHVRSIIESEQAERPEDSALKHHYDTMIDAKVEQYLFDLSP